MDDNIGAFIVLFYVVIWIFTALSYESDEGQGTWYVWAITFFWPLLALKKIKEEMEK